jgi:hypothetical protein
MTISHCSRCGRPLLRIASNPDGNGRTMYEDDNGRRWNGHECPDCVLLRHRGYKRKRHSGQYTAANPVTPYEKYCRVCRRNGAAPLDEERWRAIHYS